jgi:hypothetical protein
LVSALGGWLDGRCDRVHPPKRVVCYDSPDKTRFDNEDGVKADIFEVTS